MAWNPLTNLTGPPGSDAVLTGILADLNGQSAPTVTGDPADNEALISLLAALADLGLIIDDTEGGGGPGPSTRHNLCVNPSLKVNTTEWFATGSSRITNATGLPRATAFVIPAGTEASLPRFEVDNDAVDYVLSAHIKGVGNSSGFCQAHYYAGDGSTWNDASAEFDWTINSGQVKRIDTGPLNVNTGTVESLMFISNEGASAIQVTAVLYEKSSSLLDFFDGDTSGAAWDGTSGNSTSTLTV